MPIVEIHAAAQADLDSLYDGIADAAASTQVAASVVWRIAKRFNVLAEFPMLGMPRQDLGADIRVFPIESRYMICYRPVPGGVRIVRIRSAWQLTSADDIPGN